MPGHAPAGRVVRTPLFEGRARLEPTDVVLPLTDDVPELLRAASDLRLVLERVERT